jgi:ABC-type tungstate transport system substrate-binding protein
MVKCFDSGCLLSSDGSLGCLSLLFLMKLMVLHFVSHSYKVMTALMPHFSITELYHTSFSVQSST